MRRLVLGLAVVAAMALGVSATGTAQTWGQSEREMRCPAMMKPSCGYGAHASCTNLGWQCRADEGGGSGSSYGEPQRSHESCLQTMGGQCQAGWLPKCHDGHWRCVPPGY